MPSRRNRRASSPCSSWARRGSTLPVSYCALAIVLALARLTWLMQPLDTHGFQRYKAHLRSQYQDARCRSAGDGDLATGEFLPCVHSAVRTVLQGTRWAGAFSQDGFGGGQAEVSSFIKRQTGATGTVQAPVSRPSDEQLACAFRSACGCLLSCCGGPSM